MQLKMNMVKIHFYKFNGTEALLNDHTARCLSAPQNKLCRLYYDTEYINLRKLHLCCGKL